jgi:hypothetical protein
MRSGLCKAGRQGTRQSVDHFSLITLMEIVDHAVHRNVHDFCSSLIFEWTAAEKQNQFVKMLLEGCCSILTQL